MIPVAAPISDQFDQLLENLAHVQVSDWDMGDMINYCAEKLKTEKANHYDLDDFAEDYEDFHGHSIVNAITDGWNFKNLSWSDFVRVEYLAVMRMKEGPPESIPPALFVRKDVYEGADILSWGIYLWNKGGQHLCVLEVANQDEARLIAESIKTHYYNS